MKKKFLYHFFLFLPAIIAVSITAYSQEVTTVADSVVADTFSSYEEEQQTPYYPDTLKQKYRSVVYDSVLAITADKGFYYKRYLDSLLRAVQVKTKKPPKTINLNGSVFFDSIFGVMFWIVAVGLFAFLVYKLFLSNSSILSRSRKNIDPDIAAVNTESAEDLEVLFQNAVKNSNYHLAVRYLYLQSLKILSDRKFIEIDKTKTNYEYVSELKHQRFANEFASLTLQYEYVWYGEYPLDRRLFEQIEDSFAQFNKAL